MILNSITWNVGPEIYDFGWFALRWYGLLFASGFVFGYFIIGDIFKKEKIPPKMLDTITTYMVVGTVIGARLGHFKINLGFFNEFNQEPDSKQG